MDHITKTQHKEGPIRLRPVTVWLAHVAKVRHRRDEISSLTKWEVLNNIELCLGQVRPNIDKLAKGKTKGEQPFEVGTEHC